ncbi:MAG: DNA primase small subunit PriS [Candidatus Bathyarchaeia archaeon]|nr:DNA primase small subunit PriS [Candidatus Bathyarchaeota archaeon]
MIEDYIKKKFFEYYRLFSWRIKEPKEITKREFGFLLFKEKIMVRHKNFLNINTLREFIKTIVPSDVYYSSAYYLKPEEEMKGKEWIGADLIFDIDADHIDTLCKKEHDKWICKNCSYTSKGMPPEKCLKCGESKIQTETWICQKCLEKAKEETLKLIDFLMKDFGFKKENIKIYFTGHRGYHIHIDSNEILQLTSDERKEIVDYVMGIGIDLNNVLNNIDEQPSGWAKRVASIIKSNSLKSLTKRRILHEIRSIIKDKAVKVDSVVTMDIHRLIRLPETLNGKTGLRAVKVDLTNLEEFNPLNEAIALEKGEEKIYIKEAPKFLLGGEEFGPYKNEEVTLPMAAALLLICKGKAKLVN